MVSTVSLKLLYLNPLQVGSSRQRTHMETAGRDAIHSDILQYIHTVDWAHFAVSSNHCESTFGLLSELTCILVLVSDKSK